MSGRFARHRTRKALLLWCFLAPSLAIFLLYWVIPIVWNLVLASIASVFLIGSASAQQAKPMSGMDMKCMDMKMMDSNPNDPVSTKGYKAAMMKMMEGMPMMKFTGDADIDFMSQMRVHHQLGSHVTAQETLLHGLVTSLHAADLLTAALLKPTCAWQALELNE